MQHDCLLSTASAVLVDWIISEQASGRALSLKFPAVQFAFFT